MRIRILSHIELVTGIFGMAIVLIMPVLFRDTNRWHVTALTAIAIGALHTALIALIHHRRRLARQETIEQIQAMLEDRIKNRLAVILLNLELASSTGQVNERYIQRIIESVDEVSVALDHLSEQSLSAWEVHYKDTIGKNIITI